MNLQNLSVIPLVDSSISKKCNTLNKEMNFILKQIKGCISVDSLISILKTKKTYAVDECKVVNSLLELEKKGFVSLKFECKNPELNILFDSLNKVNDICKKNPGLWNIAAGEREWQIYPQFTDYLNESSDIYYTKLFEKQVYFELMKPFLRKLPKNSTILDAGGGIGRFGIEIAKMGYNLHFMDSSVNSLKNAVKHFCNNKISNVEFHLEDISQISTKFNNYFDAVISIEVICYSSEPLSLLEKLINITKKKGIIVVAVEGKYGAIVGDRNLTLDDILTIWKREKLNIDNYLYTVYYQREKIENIFKEKGIKVLLLEGCQYITDGLFNRFADETFLKSEKNRKKLMEIEKRCRKDPMIKELARSWLIIGEKT